MHRQPEHTELVAPMRICENPEGFKTAVAEATGPAVFRDGAAHWNCVRVALQGDDSLLEYLGARDKGTPVFAIVGQPDIQGRFGFSPDLRQLNHKAAQVSFSSVLKQYPAAQQSQHAIAIQAAPVRELLRNWDQENPLTYPPSTAAPTLWLSNQSVVATHADSFDNIACVAAGRRRFTLFPPEAIAALSLGPLMNAPGGVPVSTLDYTKPRESWDGKLEHALKSAVGATLEPGDIIFIPALWWHGVEALGPLNLLINFWWGNEPTDGISPYDAMSHAILAISRLPVEKRQRWKHYFDHLVFRLEEAPGDHLPEGFTDLISEPSDQQAREVTLRIAQSLAAWAKR
ncbi:MAG: cupin-like domain-containing protein [Congregibacter sp.]